MQPAPESQGQHVAPVLARLESLRPIFFAARQAEEFAALYDELLARKEFALALRTLCDFLLEPDVPAVSDDELETIASLQSLLGAESPFLQRLKEKVERARPAPPPVSPPPSPAKPLQLLLHSSLRYKIIAITAPEHVHPPGPSDDILGISPKAVIAPGSESELAEILRLANEAGLTVIPRGGRTKLAWGHAPSRADIVLSTARLNRILEHASSDLTVSVEAGCTIQALQETLAQHGQRLAIDPLWPEKATVGGVLSTNDSGALRLRFGALRDLIIGVTLALPDGTLASSGGKVVKNVAGYDLPKLATGAFGTLGIITRAVFRLHPLPRNTRSFSIAASHPAAARDLVLALQDSKLAHSALQSRFSKDSHPSVDILFEGTEAGLDAQAAQLRELCHPAEVSEASHSVWDARQELWSFTSPEETAVVKMSTLPANLAHVLEFFQRVANLHGVRWKSVIYATGLGWIRLEGSPEHLQPALVGLRNDLAKTEGSLVVLHRPKKLLALDPWGYSGDSLTLMKAIKHQLDPADTLNPCRFLTGI